MRRYVIASRILLILFVVNFALAAPVAVRGIHEVRVDMTDVTEGGTGASQKRMDPWDEWPTSGETSEPWDRWSADEATNVPPTPGNLDTLIWFQHPPPSPASSGSPGASGQDYETWHHEDSPEPNQWLEEDPNDPSSSSSEANPLRTLPLNPPSSTGYPYQRTLHQTQGRM